jgi:hypothetical protein
VDDKASGVCRLRIARGGELDLRVEEPDGFERSYALSANAAECEPALIRTLVLKLVPPATA